MKIWHDSVPIAKLMTRKLVAQMCSEEIADEYHRLFPFGQIETLLCVSNILPAHQLAHFPILDAYSQFSNSLFAQLNRQKVTLLAQIPKSDPRKKYPEITSDAHYEFLKIELSAQ